MCITGAPERIPLGFSLMLQSHRRPAGHGAGPPRTSTLGQTTRHLEQFGALERIPFEAGVKRFALALLLLTVAGGLHAETRYVTDQLKITMRSGESTTHKIVRMLPSGYPVEVLETNRDSGYSKIRTGDGKTGYVLTRQLMKIPSARERLEKAEARLQELQEEPGRLSTKLTTLRDEHQTLQGAHAKVTDERNNLAQELDAIQRTAANAIRISNERNELRKQVATLTRQVEDLKQENRELSNDTAQNWFLIGAGVIVGGIIIGLILPHLRLQRRKSSWGSL